jgi:hypothetical protein
MVSNTYTSGDTYNSGLRLRGYRGGNNNAPTSYNLVITRNNINNDIIEIRNLRRPELVEYLPRIVLDTIRTNFTDRINRMVVFVRGDLLSLMTEEGALDSLIDINQLNELVPVASVFPPIRQESIPFVSGRTAGGGFFDFLFSKKVQPEVAPSPALESKPAGKSKKSKKSIKKQKITKRNKK